ncbi:MAG TPA: hypothetical protein VL403_03975 [Candidatus Kryptonia bacterium]|nr:hypothetical protein [Candidatus Kryptonia bacterium]
MADPEHGNRVCHHCGTDIGRIERVGRRDACLQCGADLHCCRNCRFYAPGHHNDCLEPQAERQVDKLAGNFCDYFSFRSGGSPAGKPAGGDARAKLDSLFAKRK